MKMANIKEENLIVHFIATYPGTRDPDEPFFAWIFRIALCILARNGRNAVGRAAGECAPPATNHMAVGRAGR